MLLFFNSEMTFYDHDKKTREKLLMSRFGLSCKCKACVSRTGFNVELFNYKFSLLNGYNEDLKNLLLNEHMNPENFKKMTKPILTAPDLNHRVLMYNSLFNCLVASWWFEKCIGYCVLVFISFGGEMIEGGKIK